MCTVLWKIKYVKYSCFDCLPLSNIFDFDSFAFWNLILELVVFKNKLTSCLCKAQLSMTFGIKNNALKQLQLIILCLILASLIVRIFAILVPVCPRMVPAQSWGLLILYASQKRESNLSDLWSKGWQAKSMFCILARRRMNVRKCLSPSRL